MIIVSIPLPTRKLSPNNRPNRAIAAIYRRAADDYQKECRGHLLVAGLKRIHVPVMIQYEFFTAFTKVRAGGGLERIKDNRYRPMDADNAIAAMKPFQDLLVKNGHIPGDESRYVGVAPPIIHSAKESGVIQGVKVWFLTPEEWRKRCS